MIESEEDLKSLLNYDPITGWFTWKIAPSHKRHIGRRAEVNRKGYLAIYIDGIFYKAHQLAWFFIHGKWAYVDHIDRNKQNNAICNLREVTHQQNTWNQRVRHNNLLGVKGVQERHGKFRAYITQDYKTYHIGTFNTIEEAIEARIKIAISLRGEHAGE